MEVHSCWSLVPLVPDCCKGVLYCKLAGSKRRSFELVCLRAMTLEQASADEVAGQNFFR